MLWLLWLRHSYTYATSHQGQKAQAYPFPRRSAFIRLSNASLLVDTLPQSRKHLKHNKHKKHMKELKTPITVLLYSVSLYVCHIVLMDLARYVSSWLSTTCDRAPALDPQVVDCQGLTEAAHTNSPPEYYPTTCTQSNRPNTKNRLRLTQPNRRELCRKLVEPFLHWANYLNHW